VTRVADDHEILVAYGDHFEDDPTQLGTTRWRDTQARSNGHALGNPNLPSDDEIRADYQRRVASWNRADAAKPNEVERFWDATADLLARLDDPDGERARARAVHEANVAVADEADEAELAATGAWVDAELERHRRWAV
jgi:hypothetical protein